MSSKPVDLESCRGELKPLLEKATVDSSMLPDQLPGPATVGASTCATAEWLWGLLLLPLSVPLLLVVSVLSWAIKHYVYIIRYFRDRDMGGLMFSICIDWLIVDTLYSIICIPYFILEGNWSWVLIQSEIMNYSLLTWFLLRLPWPHGANKKLFAMARGRFTTEVRARTGIDNYEDDEAKKRRTASLKMLRDTDGNKGGAIDETDILLVLKDMVGKGADVNFPDSDGKTVLLNACQNGDNGCVEWLLNHGANPNIQDFANGYSAMHHAVDIFSTDIRFSAMHLGADNEFKSDNVVVQIMELLLDHESPPDELLQRRGGYFEILRDHVHTQPDEPSNIVDFSILDHKGRTPYMLLNGKKRPRTLEALLPSPSWEEVETVLSRGDNSIESICAAFRDLLAESSPRGSRALRRLRILDMLFCDKEGDEGELTRRRKVVFNRFLKSALLRSVQEPKIDEDVKELLVFIFNQSAGPPQEEKNARASYQTEFDAVMKECSGFMENLYGGEFDRLIKEDPDFSALTNLPKKNTNVPNIKELNNGRFTAPPQWALDKDLAGAIRGLQDVGVIESADMFCDLIQQGRHHRLLKTPNPKLFKEGPDSLRFWQALVLLWSIGLQEKMETPFNKKMKTVAGEAFSKAPGIKALPRSAEKAIEYVAEKDMKGHNEQVCAGLHVIDGLRCSFMVDTVAENISVGRRLEEQFPVARTKNSHQLDNRSYADRKYNLVFRTTIENIGEVAFLCEVQILMTRYIEIKKIGHLLYEFQR